MSEQIHIPIDAYVLVQQERLLKQGYADILELAECLDAFYNGHLDDVPDLTRLWMPCDRLIPGKRLLSVLDSDLMRRCLYRLPETYSTAISYHYEQNCPELSELMAHFFVHSGSANFGQYCLDQYIDAIAELAIVVYRTI